MRREKDLRFGLSLLGLMLFASIASAGWVTFRNDSPRGIIVQEVTKAPDGSTKRSRPTRLLSGETLREFHIGPMAKVLEVFDMQAPGKPLFSGRITWVSDNQIFSILSNGKSASVTPSVPKITLPTATTTPKKP